MGKSIQELLEHMVEVKASDLHISTGQVPLMRLDGDLVAVEGEAALSEQDIETMLTAVLPQENSPALKDILEHDFSFAIAGKSRFRVNIFKHEHGYSGAFRAIPVDIPSFEDLGLPEVFERLCNFPNGIVLITGPTGSGKSTTLAAMIDYINERKPDHIITIEDPVEFVHKSKKSLIQHREVGKDTESFNMALRAALREDPDNILVGEMRDIETIRLALTAAETGHLVFATLHTNSASKTVNRIVDVFPSGEKDLVRMILAGSLRAVVAQTLLKRKGGGRVAAYEIMLCNTAISNMIRENKTHQIQSAIETGTKFGMQTMAGCIDKLNQQGLVDVADIPTEE